MRRLHPDVLGAAKLNMLREFGKFVPLNHDKEGPQLQEAEVPYNTAVRLRGCWVTFFVQVQRLRLLYSTPSKNWFSSNSIRNTSNHNGNKPSKWRRLGKANHANMETHKQKQFAMFMSYQDQNFATYDDGRELLQ
jgi:hypothetical protein